MKKLFSIFAMVSLICIAPIGPAHAFLELITNGDFETGDFTGWIKQGIGDLYSDWYISSGTTAPAGPQDTVGPAGGAYFAISDTTGPAAQSLIQTFTVPTNSSSVILDFDMFVNNWWESTIIGTGFDFNGDQYARVDILAGGSSPFDVGTSIVANLYAGADTVETINPYTHYLFDITPIVGAGGDYILRYGSTQTFYHLQQGIDNVSIVAEGNVVPEPATMLLFGSGLLGAFVRRRRRS